MATTNAPLPRAGTFPLPTHPEDYAADHVEQHLEPFLKAFGFSDDSAKRIIARTRKALAEALHEEAHSN